MRISTSSKKKEAFKLLSLTIEFGSNREIQEIFAIFNHGELTTFCKTEEFSGNGLCDKLKEHPAIKDNCEADEVFEELDKTLKDYDG